MFTLRQKIFITSGIVVAIILIIVFILFYLRPKDNQVNNGDNNAINVIDQNVVDSNNPQILTNNSQNISKPDGTPEELFVKQMARFFVERFFTYSNQNENIHIAELQESVTESMRTWMLSKSLQQDVSYSGVTTNVLSSSLTEFDNISGVAKVTLEISQEFSKQVDSAVEKETKQKTIEVDFKLLNGEWKVDGVWDRQN
ncbi:MAG: hypothetical protein ACD_18C00010G0002 [uncultured bacterium]|nr:MAG: hypothetical protein ACD_18C00010G0002 [uncultured bacterium]